MARVGGNSGAITPDTSRGIIVSDAAGADRVLIGEIDATTHDYGIKVTSSDGTTVIIDGTSNMFKILATGTRTLNVVANSQNSSATDLTGLGTFATTPAHHSHVSFANTDAASKFGTFSMFEESGSAFVAASSGGAVTKQIIGVQKGAEMSTQLAASIVRQTIWGYNQGSSSATDFYGRYYILREAAL